MASLENAARNQIISLWEQVVSLICNSNAVNIDAACAGVRNELVQTINRRITGEKTKDLVNAIRRSPLSVMAVCTGMTAIGADIRAVAMPVFIRDVNIQTDRDTRQRGRPRTRRYDSANRLLAAA